MRVVSLLLLAGLLAGTPAAAEHRFADSLAGVLIGEIQTQLASRGYYAGTPTGRDDAATTAAIRAWQADAGLPETGIADDPLLNRLRFGLAEPVRAVRPAHPPADASQAREVEPLPAAPLPQVAVEPLPPPETQNAPAEAAEAFEI